MPYRYRNTIIYRRGERGSGLRVKGQVQDFFKLRDKCLADGILFEDPEFRAQDSSISSQTSDRPFHWMRPTEIVNNPLLFVDVASRFDIQRGELGNYWLLDAISIITLHNTLFHRVVPDDQSFGYKYAGIFHFRFWQCGHWVDVVIDDRLPTTVDGKLVFLYPSERNEFWSALLEKAYAKLHGSYEALKEGTTTEAMEDFTGGITERYELSQPPPNLHKIMLKAYQHVSLMACAIEEDPNTREAQTPEGLVKGRVYDITMIRYVEIETHGRTENAPFIRLRNPWRNETEWNGPWSVKSREWRIIPEHKKQEIGLTFDNDDEFWMSFKDFEKHFSNVEICNLNPEAVEEQMLGRDKKRWEMSVFEGEWVKGVTAGGCRNYLETFCLNPQYRIDPDQDDDDDKCSVVIALMQKNRKQHRKMGVEVRNIGFIMYYLNDPDNQPKPLGLNFFKNNRAIARSPSFINVREVSCRFKLPPGVYCIIPSTFEPNKEGEFLLRVLSENKNNMKEHDEVLGMAELDARVPVAAERVEPMGEAETKSFFDQIAGEDNEVDWAELKQLLDYALKNELILVRSRGRCCDCEIPLLPDETKKGGFSEDVCRRMVAVSDIGRSGALNYEEFRNLWNDILDWTSVFKMYDSDASGYLNSSELRQALNSAGYRLNNRILSILGHRYANKDGLISYEDFIVCAIKLKAMIDIFKQKDPDDTNSITVSMEEWIEYTIYS